MATPESERDAQAVSGREQVLRSSGRDFGGEDDSYNDIQAEYVAHAREYGKGAYPQEGPKAPSPERLITNPVDPGATKPELFIQLDAYEDAGGKPLTTSPIEILRRDLGRLQGEPDGKSLNAALTMTGLGKNDFGAWGAASTLHDTADMARTTIGEAINRVYSTYEAVVQALDDTIKTVKAADKTIAGDRRTSA